MNSLKGLFEDSIEKVEEGVKSQAKVVVQSTKSQVTGGQQQTAAPDHGTNEAAQADPSQQASKQATEEFVKDLYAPSQNNHAASQGDQKQPSQFVQDQIKDGKTPEEAMKLEALRKKLHDEVYYIPLTQRKSHEQEVKEEEQKEEQKKMEDLQTEEEKKKKEQPIAVQMGANRAERFPGASG